MKGDFSRFTFRRERHYSSVRMQQGRVQLDADWNEQADILAHLRHTEARDVIGASGVPHERGGFLIDVSGDDLSISDGRIYVDGVLVENESTVLYKEQPYYPLPGSALDSGLYLVYLDVWQRHIAAPELPVPADREIREVALGGPDTGTRTQVIWQTKLLWVGAETDTLTCWDVPDEWTALINRAHGKMSAQTKPADTESNPCSVPASAGYRRLENQLYRVEIHDRGAAGTATFKWSRDNGMVVTRLLEVDGTVLSVADAGRDEVLGFGRGQWIEVSDEAHLLRGEPGVLVSIQDVVENTIMIDSWPGAITNPSEYFDLNTATVRRWDHVSDIDPVAGDATGTVAVTTGNPIDLESGVQVNFYGAAEYETGDYWLIPARTVSSNSLGGDIEWPRDPDNAELPAMLPPQGIEHHYARLALVAWDGEGFTFKHDCRLLFPALTEPDLYYISGDGQEAMPNTSLPQPLRVGVSNCSRPVEGAWVMFKIREGNGELQPHLVYDEASGDLIFPQSVVLSDGTVVDRSRADYEDFVESLRANSFIVPTDALGQAYSVWHMQQLSQETDAFGQLVEVSLLRVPQDQEENKLDIPVVFGASFAVAWQDRFGGSVFPDAQYPEPGSQDRPNLVVHTVEDALDQLRQNVALAYVSGDGQEARRLYVQNDGSWVRELTPLPQSLVVRAANGDWPFENARVRFRISGGDGSIQPADGAAIDPVTTDDGRTTEFVVETNAQGLAACQWELGSNAPHQQVTATLENTLPAGTDNFVVFPSDIIFNANLSIADEVAYDGSVFPDDTHPGLEVHTVEDALDQLRENTTLLYVSGDGQEVYPGEQLAKPLQVRVANGQWPREGAMVRFTADYGTLSDGETSGSELTVPTNADGLALCDWTPDIEGPVAQQVQAVLVLPSQFAGSEDPSTPGIAYFNANLSKADQIYYSPSTESLEEVPPDRVQGAIDELYKMKVNNTGDIVAGDLGINANFAVERNVYVGYYTEESDGGLSFGEAEGHAVVAINGGLHIGGSSDPGNDNLEVDGNLSVHGNLLVQGETILVSTDQMRGNVVLGDEDTDTVTVEGKMVTGHSTAKLQIASPVNVAGGLDVSGAAQFAGNVVLGDADTDTVTVEGQLLTGHSSGQLRIASPVAIAGGISASGAAAFAGNVSVGGVLQGTSIVGTNQIADGAVTAAKLDSSITFGGGDISRIHRVPLLQQTLFHRAFATVTGLTSLYGCAFDGTFLWIGNSSGTNLTKLDINQNTVVTTIPGFSGAYGLAYGGGFMWVASTSANSVSKIDINTHAVLATAGGMSVPYRLAYDGTNVWVANSGSGTLAKIDVGSGAVSKTVSGFSTPWGLAFDGKYLWVGNLGNGTVSKLDVSTDSVVTTIEGIPSPYGMAFDGDFVWVGSVSENSVRKIDVSTNKVVATVTTPTSAWRLAFDGDHLWLGSHMASTVSKIDVIKNTVVATVLVNSTVYDLVFDGAAIWALANSGSLSKIRKIT